jgi:hypothetical protein
MMRLRQPLCSVYSIAERDGSRVVNNIGAVKQHFRYSLQRTGESRARVRELFAVEIGILEPRVGKNF